MPIATKKYIIIVLFLTALIISIGSATASSDNSSAQLSTAEQHIGLNKYSSSTKSEVVYLTNTEIATAAVKTKIYIEKNKKIPNRVQVGGKYVNMAQLLHIMTLSTIRLNANNHSNIPLKSDIIPTSNQETLIPATIPKTEYMDLSYRINSYMNINRQAPIYSLLGQGKLSFYSQIYLYSRILYQYKAKGTLPSFVNIKSWKSINIPIIDDTNPKFTPQQIIFTSVNLQNYFTKNKDLPPVLRVGSSYINMAQYLQLATITTQQINHKTNLIMTLKPVNNPLYINDDFIEGNLSSIQYLDIAKGVTNYYNQKKLSPPYWKIEQGNMGFQSLVYNFSQVLKFYYNTKILPTTIKIKPWSDMTNNIKMVTIVKGTGGNVLDNYYVNKYLTKTSLTNKIVELAKIGTPMVTMGNGHGPKIMIIAGVHGNELPSPIAALNLINHLSNKTINGTLYIIPLAIPYNTATSNRYWQGQNPNRVANITGTPTNQIIRLAKQLKITILGDYHSSQPGGDPGMDSVLCSISPQYESYRIASYITKKTNSKLISYPKAGEDYPGAVEDVSNLVGIPSVTCEVVISHGTASTQKIDKSYTQMISLLNYKNILSN